MRLPQRRNEVVPLQRILGLQTLPSRPHGLANLRQAYTPNPTSNQTRPLPQQQTKATPSQRTSDTASPAKDIDGPKRIWLARYKPLEVSTTTSSAMQIGRGAVARASHRMSPAGR